MRNFKEKPGEIGNVTRMSGAQTWKVPANKAHPRALRPCEAGTSAIHASQNSDHQRSER